MMINEKEWQYVTEVVATFLCLDCFDGDEEGIYQETKKMVSVLESYRSHWDYKTLLSLLRTYYRAMKPMAEASAENLGQFLRCVDKAGVGDNAGIKLYFRQWEEEYGADYKGLCNRVGIAA